MTSIMDHYPPDYSTSCVGYGESGRCGEDCPRFIDSECPNRDEVQARIDEERREEQSETRIVTHDMAIDAGMPEIEGTEI